MLHLGGVGCKCSALAKAMESPHFVAWTTVLHQSLVFYLFIYLFYFKISYWFCHTSTCIPHGCTRVSHPELPPTSLPIPSLWVIPVHHPQASCILHQTWTVDSFLIWYYTCFNAILPNHPPTPSPTESKRLFYTRSYPSQAQKSKL